MRTFLLIALATMAACDDGGGFECTDRDTSNRLSEYAPEGASECVTQVMLVGALYEECTTHDTTRPTVAEAEESCALASTSDPEPWCWGIYLRSTCHEMAQPQESGVLFSPCSLFQPSEVIPSCAAAE